MVQRVQALDVFWKNPRILFFYLQDFWQRRENVRCWGFYLSPSALLAALARWDFALQRFKWSSGIADVGLHGGF
jgi:hypothetical protein